MHVPDVALPDTRRTVYSLGDDVLIGSAEVCDIRLDGLAPYHCRVAHDEDDEFVAIALGGVVRVHGAPVEEGLLRTGARLELGEPLHDATLEDLDDHLVAAAGLPGVSHRPPDHVAFSPGVHTVFGFPTR